MITDIFENCSAIFILQNCFYFSNNNRPDGQQAENSKHNRKDPGCLNLQWQIKKRDNPVGTKSIRWSVLGRMGDNICCPLDNGDIANDRQ